MSHLPAGIAAFMAVTAGSGGLVIYADGLTRAQRTIARIMVFSRAVYTRKPYALIEMSELKTVEREAA